MAQLALLLSIAMAGLATRHAFAAEPSPASLPSAAVLHLTDGNFAPGELENSTKPGILRWHATPFVSPFEFPINAVNAIHWPPPATLAKPTADYCFELAGGDVLFGSLVGLDDKQAALDVPRIGRLHVDRSHIHRIYRWRDSADLIYLGPNGLNGWTETSPARANPVNVGAGNVRVFQPAPIAVGIGPNGRRVPMMAPEAPPAERGWREESGQLVTEKEGTAIGGDFGLPARASIEFEISWKNKPDFVFALGINDADRPLSSKRAFRFEAWGGDLVVQRELEHEADLAVVQELAPGPGRAHLHVYLDQEKGRILVFSQAGKRLADLTVANPVPSVLPGLLLANVRGDLRLESLRIGRWSGELPREVKTDQARIHRADGSIEYGNVTQFDPAANEFVVRGESGQSRIAQDKITSVFLSLPIDEPPRAIRAIYQDGARLSGDLEKVEQGSIWFRVPGIQEALGLPIAGLRSLVTLRHEPANTPAKEEWHGRLEMDTLWLTGQLVDGGSKAGSSCLVWKPVGSETASPLRPNVSGRIIYKEPRPQSATTNQVTTRNGVRIVARAAPRQPAPRQGVGGMVMRFTEALAERPADPTPPEREPRSLYLRDGDVIPSVITKIDEAGVTFKTSLSASTFVPHDKVKAVELSPDQTTPTTVRLTKAKQERLLTLPRMQKPDPPTQLIRSKNGDYLRGRLLRMDDKTLQVEIHLETKDVPRDRIARIIWLHADEFDESKKPPKSSDPNATRVQAMRNDGVRLTFLAETFADSTLSGKSEVLGPCRVALKEMDQLLIGGAIDKAAATLIYQQWKLKNAQEPKYVTAAEGDASGNGTGVESPLVGKPAPDFELALLGGKRFHLADSRGKVVVLDFWATWCGPCIQSMPQVLRATRDFQDQGVQLVAVNLQETPDKITPMLERHKLNLAVALDRDGIVADRYQAAAIPQTVIIQRDGNVARLFIGGGTRFEEQLREAIKSVLAGDKPKEAKK
jgi:peroxiredoxin